MFYKVLPVAISLYLFGGILYFGHIKPAYSHFRHTISELGEVTYSKYRLVSWGLFFPIGLLLAIFAWRNIENEILSGLSSCLAAGYLVAAFFPCDEGSPFIGSARQQIHNLGGFAEYAGGMLFLFRASENDVRIFSVEYKVVGMILMACLVIISIPGTKIRGVVQRIAETLLFGSLIHLSWASG